ncbi:EF-hand calcium-binding domain-containing protein 5-like isoform X2 [Styela clava]
MAAFVVSLKSETSLSSHFYDSSNPGQSENAFMSYESVSESEHFRIKSIDDYDEAARITSRHELSSRHSSASSRGTSRIYHERDSVGEIDSIKREYHLPTPIRNNIEKMKRQREYLVEQRLFANMKEKKRRKQEKLQYAQALERKLPMDVLAEEWFSSDEKSAEIRVYLIENLMPTLILGLEKVLLEAEKRNLIEKDNIGSESADPGGNYLLPRPTFNPINSLAQYLMRNNPKFSNFPEASPYARGLRSVAEDLKRQVFDLKNNRVAELREEARTKRKELEESETRKIEEEMKRKSLMRKQFEMWLLDETQKLHLQLIQNALYSYMEISAHLSSQPESVVKYSKELEPTDETGLSVDEEEFVEYLEEHLKELAPAEFNNVLRHLNQCALAFRKTFEHERWNTMFYKLFENLDTEQTGYIDRHRILHLLEKFWDQVKDSQHELRNPRKWPVIELEELDDLFPESDDENESESIKVSTQEEEEENEERKNLPSNEVSPIVTETEVQKSVEEGEESKKPSPTENAAESESEQVVEGNTIDTEVKEEDQKAGEKADDIISEIVESVKSNQTPSTEVVKMASAVDGKEEHKEINSNIEEKSTVITTDTEQVEEQTPVAPEVASTEKEVKETAADTDEQTKEKVEEEDKEEHDDVETMNQIEDEKLDKTEIKITDKEKVEVEEKTKEELTEKEENEQLVEREEKSLEIEPTLADKLLRNITGGMTLNTPTVADESESSEAVKIQFSKETPQLERQVRKTTSYSIVAPKKENEQKKWGEELITSSQQFNGEKIAPPSTITQSGDQEDGTEELLSTYFNASSSHVVQRVAADMDDDNLFPYPVDIKTRPASASRMSVTFAAEAVILPDKPPHEFFSEFSSRSQSRITSVFDENQLNKNRFVALLETFLSDNATHHIVESLLNFIHLGYIETEEEKMLRLARAHKEALAAKHHEMIENIFNKWDNDGQGYLDIETIEDVLSKYKGGMEASALKRGRMTIRQFRKQRFHDSKINRKEFHKYITAVCDAMAGGEEVFDGVIEFVITTVERTHAESVRGEARRKWLGQIKSAAECSGATMAPVYRFIFQILYKDAEAHGNQKKISAYIALLEKNVLYPSRGDLLLRYTACTLDNAPSMIGKAYYEDMRGVSFYCVRRGKLVHVPRVHSHGRIYFWNPERLSEEKEASLVLIPIKDEEHRVFGIMGIDNIIDPADRSVFANHELNFYQGVAKAFSSAFHHVDLKRKLLRIIDSAMSWIHSRAPLITNLTVYFVEPDPKSNSGNVLRKMMFADNFKGVTHTYNKPARLYRKDNLFRDYLFKCMETSETTTADAYGEYHTAYPLRGEQGRCQCLIDISLGKQRSLPRHEAQEMQRMLKLLQAANKEVLRESSGGKKTIILEAEEKASDETRVEIMFDRLMLTDLRENVVKLDTNVFAELHNYKVPPPMIHNILKAVLMLFYQEEEDFEQFQDWVKCKQLATTKLRQQIVTFDPTADGAVSEESAERISGLLKGIAHGAVARHGSIPAQQLYNWAFVCLSLIEHTKKSGDSCGQPALTPLTSASTATTTDTQDTANY